MSAKEMAPTTPRRSSRIPHQHTPKMSERKKSLFQGSTQDSRESLTKHRQLDVLDSESESDDCDLGIMGTLDSSSCDEHDSNAHRTPKKTVWHGTRSQSRKLLQESQDLKNFIRSPFTLKKYQTRYSCPETRCTGSVSTPATPHLQNHPGTPSSTHSCASVHTTSSTSSRARKSLASLIADTESCSSSLKDLNFDTDSGTDSKENTPSKSLRRSTRRQKLTPKFQSFKGILIEQKKNASPKTTVCLTKMDLASAMSPTQMLKTPHNTSEAVSPPKISHNRRSVHIIESPDSVCDSEKTNKRLHYDNKADIGPNSKHPRLDTVAPKARLSLFNCDRLKEILSAKSFYGKSNPDLNINITAKISNAIEVSNSHRRRLFTQSHSNRRKRRPGQINSGVKHRIRKPKAHKNKIINPKGTLSLSSNVGNFVNSTTSSVSQNDSSMLSEKDTSMLSQNISQDLGNDKTDPFDDEKQTIEALLSQWTEEEIPESELNLTKTTLKELPCFSNSVIEETHSIFQPVTAVHVSTQKIPKDSEAVFIELGAQKDELLQQNLREMKTIVPEDVTMAETGHKDSHGEVPENGQFLVLPVDGGYILVEEENRESGEEDLPDLDEIDRELKMLDEQILRMAQSNNMDPEAVLASTDTTPVPAVTALKAVTKAVTDTTPLPAATDTTLVPAGTDTTPVPVVIDPDTVPIVTDTAPYVTVTNNPSTSIPVDPPKNEKSQKLFSIFNSPNPGSTTPTSKGVEKSKRSLLKNGSDQYVIDAGQKKFGATQCSECGVIYQIGDPQDEHDHLVHHNASDVLKFNPLKEEFVVGRSDTARCIRMRGGEPGWKRVEALLARVVHPHLGYSGALPRDNRLAYTAYLYIDRKQIVGCAIVEPRLKAYKLIPGEPDCCSVEDYPVKCGVSRIWTHINYRRRGLASRLLDCARASFLYGSAIGVSEIAFSAPTAQGKALATKYCGTPNFYVYLD